METTKDQKVPNTNIEKHHLTFIACMIPKTIHYCWFGHKPYPKLMEQCIASWRKHCPDYEIKEWNEENAPLQLYPFAQDAINAGKYAFASDVIRLYALYSEGGIYLDTDVELLKSLDPLLNNSAFIGYEKDIPGRLHTAVMGAEKGNIWMERWLYFYLERDFSSRRRKMAQLVNTILITQDMQERGIELDGGYQELEGITLYPSSYFCPMSYGTHFIETTPETYCIHYFSFSWSEPETLKGHIRDIIISITGERFFRKVVNRIRSFYK